MFFFLFKLHTERDSSRRDVSTLKLLSQARTMGIRVLGSHISNEPLSTVAWTFVFTYYNDEQKKRQKKTSEFVWQYHVITKKKTKQWKNSRLNNSKKTNLFWICSLWFLFFFRITYCSVHFLPNIFLFYLLDLKNPL